MSATTPNTRSPHASRNASDSSERVLVVGATSAIAEAALRIYAQRGARLFLLARDSERLETMAADLAIRGAHSVEFQSLDANDCTLHRALLERAWAALGSIDIALVAYGSLGDQKRCEADFDAAARELTTNAISVLSWLTHLANLMEGERRGTIATISSVAGDRGRQSNYVYGTAKGALNVFLQGLRNRLYRSGVNVLTIKPGFVDTPMTRGFKKSLLWASPDAVAADIVRAVDRRKLVIYTPFYWRFIMAIIKSIPEALFRRLRL